MEPRARPPSSRLSAGWMTCPRPVRPGRPRIRRCPHHPPPTWNSRACTPRHRRRRRRRFAWRKVLLLRTRRARSPGPARKGRTLASCSSCGRSPKIRSCTGNCSRRPHLLLSARWLQRRLRSSPVAGPVARCVAASSCPPSSSPRVLPGPCTKTRASPRASRGRLALASGPCASVWGICKHDLRSAWAWSTTRRCTSRACPLPGTRASGACAAQSAARASASGWSFA
mmetsp:Transcript_53364/g.170981  ORF Transcript_53364/g.170981 Transcript_53364/m.170981 type:complete len:227 (-) Transcript_53364:1612-2292(-)